MRFVSSALALVAICIVTGCEGEVAEAPSEPAFGAPAPPAPAPPSNGNGAAPAPAGTAPAPVAFPTTTSSAPVTTPAPTATTPTAPVAAPTAAQMPAGATAPGTTPGTTSEAQVGVGTKGKDYGGPGLVTTPVETYFRTLDRVAFEVQIPNAMKLYKAGHDNKGPATHEEFMDVIIKENAVQLPELPAGEEYVYDPATEKLMISHPAK